MRIGGASMSGESTNAWVSADFLPTIFSRYPRLSANTRGGLSRHFAGVSGRRIDPPVDSFHAAIDCKADQSGGSDPQKPWPKWL